MRGNNGLWLAFPQQKGDQNGETKWFDMMFLKPIYVTYQPDEDPVKVLEANGVLRRYTSSTIYEPDALRSELKQVREQGYSLDLEEREPGVRCVACPIKAAGGKVIAAVSVSGPTQRLPVRLLRGELAAAVKAAAAEISIRLGYAGAERTL